MPFKERWRLFLELFLKYVETSLPETPSKCLFTPHFPTVGHILTSKNISHHQRDLFAIKPLYFALRGKEAMPKSSHPVVTNGGGGGNKWNLENQK